MQHSSILPVQPLGAANKLVQITKITWRAVNASVVDTCKASCTLEMMEKT